MNRGLFSLLAAFLLAGSFAIAQEDKVPAPPAGAKRIDKDKPGTILYQSPAAIPESDNPEDYVRWISSFMDPARKNVLAIAAYMAPLDYDARSGKAKNGCIWHKDAYSYERIGNTNEYKVSCYSGKDGKQITSLAYYRMRVEYEPVGCDSEAKIREHFKNKAVRNKAGAMAYATINGGFCKVKALYVNQQKPVEEAYSLSPDDVAEALNRRGNLRNHLSAIESRVDAKSDSRGGFDTKIPVKGVTKDEDEAEKAD